jgi:TM2 domain-containing membrane protein YozV
MKCGSILAICACFLSDVGIAQIAPLQYELRGDFGSTIDVRLSTRSTENKTKSVSLALVLSLVLPGAGEFYAGNFETGKYFLMADGTFWLTFAAFRFRGDWLREDARSFGTQHAGADFSGKDDQFLVNVGSYRSVDEYNQAQLRERQFHHVYHSPRDAWYWDNDENRLRFRQLRVSSDQMYENAKFAVGALVVNRIISAFSAARAASRVNAAASKQRAWRVGAEVMGHDAHGIVLKVSKEF